MAFAVSLLTYLIPHSYPSTLLFHYIIIRLYQQTHRIDSALA